MAFNIGTATINFGAFPGSCEATVTVTGQAAISATSKVSAFFMADDSTGSNTASDHRVAAALVGLSCGTPTPATGFPIYAVSRERLTGTFVLRFVWTD